MQIYVSKDGQQYGPYSSETLKQCVKAGSFSENDYACYDGQNWILISELYPISSRESGGEEQKKTEDVSIVQVLVQWLVFGVMCYGVYLGYDHFFGDNDSGEVSFSSDSETLGNDVVEKKLKIPLAIPCVACKAKISTKVESCLQCGHPIEDSLNAYKNYLSSEKEKAAKKEEETQKVYKEMESLREALKSFADEKDAYEHAKSRLQDGTMGVGTYEGYRKRNEKHFRWPEYTSGKSYPDSYGRVKNEWEKKFSKTQEFINEKEGKLNTEFVRILKRQHEVGLITSEEYLMRLNETAMKLGYQK